MSDHTPGPWTLHEADERDDDGTRLFNIHPVERLDYIREADARLIAAAPELLAALERVLDRLWTHYESARFDAMPQVVAARAAIAKAKGEA